MNNYYVYEWYIEENNNIFHVGKGKGNRMFSLDGRNNYFMRIYNKYKCNVRKYKDCLSEEEAWKIEKERIEELKTIGQAQTNLHEGGRGGNTFKYINKNDMKVIKDKIGITTKEHWKQTEYREKTLLHIRESMNRKDVRDKVSIRTKKAMSEPNIRKLMLENGLSSPVILIYKDKQYFVFETLQEYFSFIKNKHNISSRIGRYMLKECFNRTKKTTHITNLDKLYGAKAYKIDKTLYKSVSTMADECKPVEEILSLLQVQGN